MDKRGDTLLHMAVFCLVGIDTNVMFSIVDVNEMVNLLIKKGSKLNAKNKEGNTPLHEAIALKNTDSYKIIECLVKNGADLSAENNQGETPLTLALQAGKTEITELLRKHGAKE